MKISKRWKRCSECWRCGFLPAAGISWPPLIGDPGVTFTQLTPDRRTAIAAIAAGFTGLLSLFNIGGRFS